MKYLQSDFNAESGSPFQTTSKRAKSTNTSTTLRLGRPTSVNETTVQATLIISQTACSSVCAQSSSNWTLKRSASKNAFSAPRKRTRRFNSSTALSIRTPCPLGAGELVRNGRLNGGFEYQGSRLGMRHLSLHAGLIRTAARLRGVSGIGFAADDKPSHGCAEILGRGRLN